MGNLKYENLSDAMQRRIGADRAAGRRPEWPVLAPLRRDMSRDAASLLRPAYVRDVEKILHSAYYNRYSDKTQVFSFYRNDDISRRALHVQLVSRTARSIGRVLGLDLDLIEAIALGHDIGHTPFGHAGERYLSELYCEHTGRYFNHNVHSVRVLDNLFPYNVTFQTLDGILCHNGELPLEEYRPRGVLNAEEFDARVERCYTDADYNRQLVPATPEGCLVRICDIIAYLGKDRQDAVKARIVDSESVFDDTEIGKHNAEFINNFFVSLVENSYGTGSIRMDERHFMYLKQLKEENYRRIYQAPYIMDTYEHIIRPMFRSVYSRVLDDLVNEREDSPVYQHHIRFVEQNTRYLNRSGEYAKTEPNQIAVDYIASMTDDYFLDLYERFFPDSPLRVGYISYFE